MHRRDLLRLLAGLPLVLGLPGLARADDEPAAAEPATLATVLAQARARGRPVLILATPRGQFEPAPDANFARRARLARHVDALLSAKDEATRLLVANLVVVIAPREELEAALGADLPRRPDPRGGPLTTGPTWLLTGKQADLVEGAFDGDDAQAATLVATLRTAVLGGVDALAPRRDLELKALGAERAAVERDLQGLGAATAADRDAASTRLAARADALAATLTHLVVAPRTDDEVRGRAKELVLRAASAATPVGASWGMFVAGCGAEDPYEEAPCMVDCGMAKTEGEARRYLHLLAQ